MSVQKRLQNFYQQGYPVAQKTKKSTCLALYRFYFVKATNVCLYAHRQTLTKGNKRIQQLCFLFMVPSYLIWPGP